MSEKQAIQLLDVNLASMPQDVTVPRYDRTALRAGIVHIGVGGFHRSHLATYADEWCGQGHTGWGIVGAGVLAGDGAIGAVLEAQDHLYTLITRGQRSTSAAIIGSLIGYVHVARDPMPLVHLVASPATQIVSLTVTEGGYPVDDRTGAYAPDAAAGPSAFDILAAGLEMRRADGGGLTVLSCDNVSGNGDTARVATLGAAERISPDLARWVAHRVAFPNSMVDRITPVTSDADRDWLLRTHGIVDRWPVVTEPFRQWVVEDHFAGDRPPLEELDIIVTADVAPYEAMKLQLLNAGHSCLAYLAALLGHETVAGAMADEDIRRFLTAFLTSEARPVVAPVAGIDLDHYVADVIERFSNPAIGDQIARLCLDGTAKFPKFLLPTVRSQLATGGPVELAGLALAGWCEYLRTGDAPLAADPLLDTAVAHARRSLDAPLLFLSMRDVFDPDVASDRRFADAFGAGLDRLRSVGVRGAIDATVRAVFSAHDAENG